MDKREVRDFSNVLVFHALSRVVNEIDVHLSIVYEVIRKRGVLNGLFMSGVISFPCRRLFVVSGLDDY